MRLVLKRNLASQLNLFYQVEYLLKSSLDFILHHNITLLYDINHIITVTVPAFLRHGTDD